MFILYEGMLLGIELGIKDGKLYIDWKIEEQQSDLVSLKVFLLKKSSNEIVCNHWVIIRFLNKINQKQSITNISTCIVTFAIQNNQ